MSPNTDRDFGMSVQFWARNASNESALLITAIRLGVFEAVPKSPAEGVDYTTLAETLGVIPRGLRSIVEPMVAMNILDMDDDLKLSLNETLVPLYEDTAFVTSLREAGDWWMPFEQLPATIRDGKPVDGTGDLCARLQKLFLQGPFPDERPRAAEIHERTVLNGLYLDGHVSSSSENDLLYENIRIQDR